MVRRILSDVLPVPPQPPPAPPSEDAPPPPPSPPSPSPRQTLDVGPGATSMAISAAKGAVKKTAAGAKVVAMYTVDHAQERAEAIRDVVIGSAADDIVDARARWDRRDFVRLGPVPLSSFVRQSDGTVGFYFRITDAEASRLSSQSKDDAEGALRRASVAASEYPSLPARRSSTAGGDFYYVSTAEMGTFESSAAADDGFDGELHGALSDSDDESAPRAAPPPIPLSTRAPGLEIPMVTLPGNRESLQVDGNQMPTSPPPQLIQQRTSSTLRSALPASWPPGCEPPPSSSQPIQQRTSSTLRSALPASWPPGCEPPPSPPDSTLDGDDGPSASIPATTWLQRAVDRAEAAVDQLEEGFDALGGRAQHLAEAALNAAEGALDVDLDGDGDIGVMGAPERNDEDGPLIQARATEAVPLRYVEIDKLRRDRQWCGLRRTGECTATYSLTEAGGVLVEPCHLVHPVDAHRQLSAWYVERIGALGEDETAAHSRSHEDTLQMMVEEFGLNPKWRDALTPYCGPFVHTKRTAGWWANYVLLAMLVALLLMDFLTLRDTLPLGAIAHTVSAVFDMRTSASILHAHARAHAHVHMLRCSSASLSILPSRRSYSCVK